MSDNNSSQSAAHKVISGSGVVFLSQVLGAVIFFVAQRYILSNLGKDENGELFTIQRIVEFVMLLLVEAGMSQIVIRNVINNPDRADSILATFLKLRFGLWFAASAILLVLTSIKAPDYLIPTLMMLLYFLVAGRTAILRIVYETRFRARTSLTLISVMAFLDTALFAVCIIADAQNLSPERIVGWYFVSALPGFLVVFFASKEFGLFRVAFDKELARDLIKECVPVIIANTFIQIQHVADVIFIRGFHTEDEAGIYSAAAKIFVPFMFVVIALQIAIMPAIAQYHQTNIERCKSYIFHSLKVLMLLAIAGSLFSSLLAPWVIEVLTSNRYADNVAHFALFPWLSLPNFLFSFIMFVNITLGYQERNYAITGALAAATLAANVIFTPQLAALGAIIAKMAATWLAAFLALYSIRDFLKPEWYRVLLLNFGVLALGSAAMCVFLPVYCSTPVSVSVAIPIFVLLVLATKTVQQPERDLLRSFAASILAKLNPGKKA